MVTGQALPNTGETFQMDIEESWSVDQLKMQLMAKNGVTKEQIKLIFEGRQMSDEKTLAGSGVKAGNTVHMVMMLRGGAAGLST